jgi:diguanylate cyclase
LSLQRAFEQTAAQILAFIDRQKNYLVDREKEFRDIIDLLTKAMATLDADNRDYYQKVYRQSEKIEEITLLNDIRTIKRALADEVESIRHDLDAKQSQDQAQMNTLSEQVKTLTAELEKVQEESRRDGLTAVFNRRAFDEQLSALIKRSAMAGTRFSLILIDIDDFKLINDTYGHTIGDRVLVAMVEKCRRYTRSDDFIARYGGDEFAIILPGASLRNAIKKARQIAKSIGDTLYGLDDTVPGLELRFSVSMGVSTFQPKDTPESLCSRADGALYKTKSGGKNGVASEKDI